MAPGATPDDPRILVCGWAGAGNVGDELLTRQAIALIAGAGGTPVVASRDPERTRTEHEVESVSWGVGARRAAASVDGVIVGPGGILQDRSSLWNLPGHLGAALAARRRSRPVAAIGVGAEPLRRRSSAVLLRRALGDAEVVTRDPASTDALGDVGVRATTGVDLALAAAFSAPPNDEIAVALGPGVRPGLLLPASRRLAPPPIESIADALDSLAAATGRSLALTSYRGPRDLSFAADLAERLRASVRIVPADVDASVAAVAGASMLVSSRYHATVVALRAGVPVAMLSGEAKLRSLAAAAPARVELLDHWSDLGAAAWPERGPVHTDEGVDIAAAAVVRVVERARASRA
ncbi:MAG: polysaccharide pyruvyl transferase family protein [Actinomycetota bacterium]